jgi:hypothetical protein
MVAEDTGIIMLEPKNLGLQFTAEEADLLENVKHNLALKGLKLSYKQVIIYALTKELQG